MFRKCHNHKYSVSVYLSLVKKIYCNFSEYYSYFNTYPNNIFSFQCLKIFFTLILSSAYASPLPDEGIQKLAPPIPAFRYSHPAAPDNLSVQQAGGIVSFNCQS